MLPVPSPSSPTGSNPSTPISRSLFSLPPSYYVAKGDEHAGDATSSVTSSRSSSLQTQHLQDVYKALGLVDMVDDSEVAGPEEQEKLVADLVSSSGIEDPISVPSTPAAIPGPEAIEIELFRESALSPFKQIQPESYDWNEISKRSDTAFVVRLKTLVNENEPDQVINVIQSRANDEAAIDIVCKFHELSVAENAPKRYETRILFVYEKAAHYNALKFDELMKSFLPKNNFPYFTIEYLDSFLARRRFANGDIEAEDALKCLKMHIKSQLPCSSLFLKLCAHYPEECLSELENLAKVDKNLPLTHLGERSLHKLAVSVVNKMKTPEGSLRKAMQILKLGVEPRDWGYVAFNTLMRLAQDEDDLLRKNRGRLGPQESQVDLLLSLINVSNLDLLDKVALLMMAGRTPKSVTESPDYAEVSLALRRINQVCSDRRESSSIHSADLEYTLDLLSLGSTSSCHLVSIILRKCVDNSAFSNGWKIASRMISISKQVFGEVVTLCSKAYFASLKKPNAEELGDLWFRRIQWCVERHLPFLNRYPCGLALHVAAHRRDFDVCWRWFNTMREQLAFRLTGYHTSAVLKAASFEEEPSLDKVRDAYSMTPSSERTTFTFIPLVRIWENIVDVQRAKHLDFWNEVADNVKTCLSGHESGAEYKKSDESPSNVGADSREAMEMGMSAAAEAQLEKVIQKLNAWLDSFAQWKKTTSNGTNLSLSVSTSRRSSRKSSKPNNSKSRRNSKPRGSGGASAHSRFPDSQPTSPQAPAYSNRRFSENSVPTFGASIQKRSGYSPVSASSPFGAGSSSLGIPSISQSESIRRWSGSKEASDRFGATGKPLTPSLLADRRSSERSNKVLTISRPAFVSSNSTPDSTSGQRRGSSNSASPVARAPFTLNPETSPFFSRLGDKFDSDGSNW